MTGLRLVWTPADFDAAVAALRLHEAVVVSGGVLLPPPRRRYRGAHRAGRFRMTVDDLKDGAR